MSVLRAVRKRKKVRKLGTSWRLGSPTRWRTLRDRHHPPRGVRRSRAGRQGGADPRPGPVGLAARAGVARPGGDGAGRRALRPEGRVGRGAPSRQQPWDGGSGGATCADSCAPHSPHRGERDPAAILRGDAWRSGRGRPAAEAGVVRDLLPQLRGRRRGDSRGDRVVEFDGVPWLHPGQRGAAAGVPGAGPVRRGRGGRVPGRQDVRRRDDGHRAGHHADGGEALSRLRRNGHGERDGADAVRRWCTARDSPASVPCSRLVTDQCCTTATCQAPSSD